LRIIENRKNQIELALFCLFFAVLYIKGPGIYPDSQTYIIMQSGREPVYPLFLAAFRLVFGWLPSIGGAEGYLWVVALVQSILALISCLCLTRVVSRLFKLGWKMEYMVAICTLLPYIMTPIASISNMVLQTAILTEGLCFPVFTFFQIELLKGMFEKTEKTGQLAFFIRALLLTVVLVLIRNQMLVALAIWAVAVLIEVLHQKKYRLLMLIAISPLVFFGGKSLGYRCYNALVDNGFQGANSGSYNLLTTLMYLSDWDDMNYLEDEYDRTLFERMLLRIEEEELGVASAPSDVLGRAYHYEDSYDVIGFDIQQEVLFNAATRHAGEDSRTTYVMKRSDVMVRSLLPHMIPRFINNYLATVMSGLERSVSMKGNILSLYAWLIWIVSLIAWIANIFKGGIKKGIQSDASRLMTLAIASILINTMAISLIIMCLSRYMVYSTALFYIALLISIKKIVSR